MAFNRRSFLSFTGLSLAAAAVYASQAKTGAANVSVKFDEADLKSSWSAVREQFSVAKDYIHLSSFFLASHPRVVREAIEKHRRALDDNPLFYIEKDFFAQPSKIETAVAEYIGGKPDEIALTTSTTMGLAFVYHGLPLKSGQEILTTEHEHYSHHESIRLATERNGASVRKIKLYDDFKTISEEDIVNRIRKAVTAKTRVVGITWVHSGSGLKLPVRRIADAVAEINKNRDAADKVLLVVDGVHGTGVEDVNIAELGADFFAAGTHKWIFGPRGTGFLWGKAENWKIMRPVLPSLSFEPFAAWMQGKLPAAMKAEYMTPGGFQAFEHFFALPAAFDFHKQIGRTRVAERIHALNDQAKEALAKMPNVTLYTPLGNKLSAGIICFDIKGMTPNAVVEKLHEKHVIASQSPYGVSYARIAPSLLNTPEEIETTLGHIRALA